MPFPEAIRRWSMDVADGKCQTLIYSEARGYHPCGSPAMEVDHIEPEAWMLAHGHDPNNESGAIPRCRTHHVGYGTVEEDGEIREASYGERQWSKHPDMGYALDALHLKGEIKITEAHQEHIIYAANGVRYWNSDDGVDGYERELMDRLARKKEMPRPAIRPHKLYVLKHWTDIFMGIREYPEDR